LTAHPAAASPAKPKPAAKPALSPDALIASGQAGRIRLIENQPKRRGKPTR
jgi:hypothetical protein